MNRMRSVVNGLRRRADPTIDTTPSRVALIVLATLGAVTVLNTVVVVFEYWVARLARSFPLAADATHNIGDVVTMLIPLVAVLVAWFSAARDRAREVRRHAEDCAQLLIGVSIAVTAIYIVVELARKLVSSATAEPDYLLVALASVVVTLANLGGGELLSRVGRRYRVNLLEAAGKHAWGDAWASTAPALSALPVLAAVGPSAVVGGAVWSVVAMPLGVAPPRWPVWVELCVEAALVLFIAYKIVELAVETALPAWQRLRAGVPR